MAFINNQTTKKYIIAFSKLFSDIHVKRYNSAGAEVKDIKVPLLYASKRKISYLLQQNADASSAGIVLPIMSFHIDGMTFDAERKMNSLNEIIVDTDETLYEGMPYNYDISLTLRTKYQEDYWQIVEQLLYLFKPELTLDVKELDFPDFVRDVMVTLEGITLENEIEMTQDEDSTRNMQANLNFKLKGYIYPDSSTDKIIEHIDSNLINKLDKLIANIAIDWNDPDIDTTITE